MITEKIWGAPLTKKKSKKWDISRCIAFKQCSNIVGEWADKPVLFPLVENLYACVKTWRGSARKKMGGIMLCRLAPKEEKSGQHRKG